MSGGSAPKAKSFTMPLMESGQLKVLNELGNYLANPQGSDYQPSDFATPYEGQLSAGPSALQQQTSAQASNFVSSIPQLMEGSRALVGDVSSRISDIFNAGPANTEAYYKTNVEDPAMRTYNQSVLPTIEKTFAGGRYGSDFQRQVQLSNQELQRNLVQSRESLLKDQLDQMYNRKLAAVGLEQNIPTMQSAGISDIANILTQGSTVGGVDQTTNQSALDRAYMEFMRQQEQGQQGVSNIFNFLSQRSKENIVSNTGGSAGNAGAIAAGVGGAATAAAGAYAAYTAAVAAGVA